MGDVISVNFGSEREWEDTHKRLVNGLIAIGALFGDDESLMRAKADCTYRVLRQIIDEVPAVELSSRLPAGLTPEQLEAVTEAIKQAALEGVETAVIHSVNMLMSAIYDLCTSKLHSLS